MQHANRCFRHNLWRKRTGNTMGRKRKLSTQKRGVWKFKRKKTAKTLEKWVKIWYDDIVA